MQTKLRELKSLLLAASDLNMANALLGWDQTTYMPAGGAPRGRGSRRCSASWRTRRPPTRPSAGCWMPCGPMKRACPTTRTTPA